ncbi:hypothetical protein ACFQS7_29470 [Dankookia sp. GCM10030260]|uniref:hypothetical protein n=1 Tax=Dankookia sp. GCM10030260 TaxID=3273390 RepID=UPI00361C678B
MDEQPMTKPIQNFLTVAEVRLRIMEWEDLPLNRRRTLCSAVKLPCRIGGKKSPATVRLDPAICLPAVDGASAIALGITPKTLQNQRAGLRYVLRRLGFLAPVRRSEPISDPDWASLEAGLPQRFHPHRLRAFMRFCAGRAVPSGGVTNADAQDYLRHLVASHGRKNARANVREALRQWNKMRGLVPGWPDTELALGPPEGQVQAPPLSAYPVHQQAEQYFAWLAQSPEDADEDDGAAHDPASPDTIETRKKALRLLLWGMVETGTAAADITRLDIMLQFDKAKQNLRFHRGRLGAPHPSRPGETLPTHGTGVLAATLGSLAVYCKLPSEAHAKLRRMLAVYRPKRQREIGDDLAALLDRLADPEIEARLLHLPQVLMHKARRLRDGWTSKGGVDHPPKPQEACWMAALAVAIEIELHLPLRIHDLARLQLDKELSVTQGSGRTPTEVHLRVTANKNGRLVETWLRGEAAKVLAEYLRDFRPLGPHPTTAWVFPNRDSEARPRVKNGFSEAITDAIHEHTGVHVNVHAFRAFAAALILTDNPHAIEDVRVMLGQGGFEIALRFYRRTNRQGAAGRLSNAISTRRQRSKPTVTPAGLPLDLARWRRGAA